MDVQSECATTRRQISHVGSWNHQLVIYGSITSLLLLVDDASYDIYWVHPPTR